jgi:hypothetical protein
MQATASAPAASAQATAETPAATPSAAAATEQAAPVQATPAQAASVPAKTRAETGQQAIPYRDDRGGLAADAGGAMFAAILLLALLVVALQFARKRGLLDRWIVATPARAAGRPQMQVEQALRVGAKTMVYRIRDGEQRYLLVESTAQSTLLPITPLPTTPASMRDLNTPHLSAEEIDNDVAATPDDRVPDDAR